MWKFSLFAVFLLATMDHRRGKIKCFAAGNTGYSMAQVTQQPSLSGYIPSSFEQSWSDKFNPFGQIFMLEYPNDMKYQSTNQELKPIPDTMLMLTTNEFDPNMAFNRKIPIDKPNDSMMNGPNSETTLPKIASDLQNQDSPKSLSSLDKSKLLGISGEMNFKWKVKPFLALQDNSEDKSYRRRRRRRHHHKKHYD